MMHTRKRLELATRLRPAELPMVEPELLVRPPRSMVWAARQWSGGTITDRTRELLLTGVARRAWITEVKWTKDSEGPEIRAGFAWEYAGQLHLGKFKGAYDAVHLALGNPEFSDWLHRTFREGQTLTVLFPENEPRKYVIYGKLELYIRRDLTCLLRDLARSTSIIDEVTTIGHLRTVLEATARLAKGKVKEQDEFIGLLVRFVDLVPDQEILVADLIEKTIETLRNGRYDITHVAPLSRFCFRYLPGTWAAR